MLGVAAGVGVAVGVMVGSGVPMGVAEGEGSVHVPVGGGAPVARAGTGEVAGLRGPAGNMGEEGCCWAKWRVAGGPPRGNSCCGGPLTDCLSCESCPPGERAGDGGATAMADGAAGKVTPGVRATSC